LTLLDDRCFPERETKLDYEPGSGEKHISRTQVPVAGSPYRIPFPPSQKRPPRKTRSGIPFPKENHLCSRLLLAWARLRHRKTHTQNQYEYWVGKIRRNTERDARHQAELKSLGWDALVIWECETRDTEILSSRITSFLE
jgi:hypothetical protein